METHAALTGLLQQLLNASRGENDDDNLEYGGVCRRTAEDPSNSLAFMLEQCRDDYEVGMQQTGGNLKFTWPECHRRRTKQNQASIRRVTHYRHRHPPPPRGSHLLSPVPTEYSLVRRKPQDVHPLTQWLNRGLQSTLYPNTLQGGAFTLRLQLIPP